jgi:hypothetical protein
MVCHGKCTQRLTLVTLNYSELMAYVRVEHRTKSETINIWRVTPFFKLDAN